ncbi:MAG: toll/interleukin-1 receptor domain-containing protein [Rhizomicrobium sp.]
MATPQDNHFVKWLATKLSLVGYEVWTDVTELQGGDVFWGDIEAVIRNRAAKVIFVHSEFAKAKTGTRKEVYLALKVGEKLGQKRFVIPLRIDDSAFDDTFIELVDIQAIDCRSDWLSGLNSLLTLLQRDGIRRDASIGADRFADLVGKAISPHFSLSNASETLVSAGLR